MQYDDIKSIESESGIIASLIHHPEYSFYSEYLLPNHFSDRENQCVYAAICQLAQRNINTIDAYNILEALSSEDAMRKIAETITVDKLQELINMSDILARHSVEEYKLLVDIVWDMARRRGLCQRLKDCEALCYDTELENFSQKVYENIDDVMTEFSYSDEIPVFGNVVDDIWAEVEAHQDGQECGIPFKIPALNNYVVIEPTELVVFAAPPKGGKSMMMLNEAVDLMRRGKSVMYIDSELSDRPFLCRMISHLTRINFNDVRSGNYSKAQEELIRKSLAWLKEQQFVHIYMPVFNTQSIYTSVKKIAHQFGELDVLIVDYLKSTGSTEAYATYSELGNLTDMIKNNIAGSMKIACLAAAQLNDNGRIADSRRIVNHASTIIKFLDKSPDERALDGEDCGNKKLIVEYNRNGMQHAPGEYIDLRFNGNISLIEQATQHEIQTPWSGDGYPNN